MLSRIKRTIRIWRLKRLGRKYYREMDWMADGYNCGFYLANVMSGGRYARAEQKFRETMDELKMLDALPDDDDDEP